MNKKAILDTIVSKNQIW